MRIEHIAFNVTDPAAAAQWLVDNLGMQIIRRVDAETQPHFVADSERATILELYRNVNAPIPDYASINPLTLHIAFLVDDVAGVREALLAAGASPEGEIVRTPDGDELAMVRSPHGFAIQLMKRGDPMVE